MTRSVELIEVSARDGLQNERTIFTTAQKVELITRSVDAGIRHIEVASFVHPRRVPQMADAEAVCAALPPMPGVTTVGLVMNLKGLERALNTRVDEIGVVVSATDAFGIANQGRTSDETVSDAVAIIERAKQAGKRAQVTISAAFGCPFEGEVAIDRVVQIASRLAPTNPLHLAVADTIGVASPSDVFTLISRLSREVCGLDLRCHFHDTRNTAVANAWAAVQAGVASLDASIAGIGGCPFAPGSSGNVATEDLLYMLHRGGVHTGVDLETIIRSAQWLSQQMGRQLPGRVSNAPPFPVYAQ